MALIAGNVISSARGRHSAFDRLNHPNKVALDFLSAYVKKLHGKIVSIDPNVIQQTLNTTLPLADFSAGIALPANVRAVDGVFANWKPDQFQTFREPLDVDLIDFAQRLAVNAPTYAAWQVNAVLFLRGPASPLWDQFASIDIAYATLPVTLQTLNDTLAVPDAAELACVEAVAAFLAGRASQEASGSAIKPEWFAGQAATAEQSYLDDVGNNVTGRMFFTQDVYRHHG